MGKATVRYVDRKGEAGTLDFNIGTFSSANFLLYFAPMTYVHFEDYNSITTTTFTGEPALGTDAIVNNDKDFKAILGFQGAEGHFKVSIPAPKINIEGGLVIRWGENRASVPPVKTESEVGIDGQTLAARMALILGQAEGSVTFQYGRLIKKS